jgi:hypothetical protein
MKIDLSIWLHLLDLLQKRRCSLGLLPLPGTASLWVVIKKLFPKSYHVQLQRKGIVTGLYH